MKTFFDPMTGKCNLLAVLALIFLISGCSKPKYTASFQRSGSKAYVTNSEKPAEAVANDVRSEASVSAAPEAQLLSASITKEQSLLESGKKIKLDKAVVSSNDHASADLKLNLPQRMMVKKALKKVEKQYDETEVTEEGNFSRTGLNQNLKIGIILILAGVLLGAVGGGIGLAPIGGIVAVIGVVFLVLGLIEVL
jgi:hypothetical protein